MIENRGICLPVEVFGSLSINSKEYAPRIQQSEVSYKDQGKLCLIGSLSGSKYVVRNLSPVLEMMIIYWPHSIRQ